MRWNMKNDFTHYLTKFFVEHLPSIKGLSTNTISSYKDTFLLFIEFLDNEKKTNIDILMIKDITKEIVEDFLNHLEIKRKNCIATRNQRLAAIQSFFNYLKYKDLSYLEQGSMIKSIPHKKSPTKSISYFTLEEIKILLNIPNTKLKNEYRDYVLLLFMYETGCRASELTSFKIKQVRFGQPTTVTLHGKGNKNRVIPLSSSFSNVLEKYIKHFKKANQDSYLFLSNQLKPYTSKGIEYILKKYVEIARNRNSNLFKDNYHNHSMRHTRAMHLLEAGVNLIYIRDFLGHSSISTTEIYAKTNPKIKEKEILSHAKFINAESKYSEDTKQKLTNMLKQKI